MTMTTGANSFTTEQELYGYFAERLNADDYIYLKAVQEVASLVGFVYGDIENEAVIQVLSDNFGATLAAIEIELVAKSITFDTAALARAINILASGKTSIQVKNNQALILATQFIDQFEFIGYPAVPTQPLQWPRLAAYDRNGLAIPTATIPAAIKTATAELAYFLLDNDITNPAQYRETFLKVSEKVGESTTSYGKLENKKLPDFIMDILKPFLSEKSAFSSTLLI